MDKRWFRGSRRGESARRISKRRIIHPPQARVSGHRCRTDTQSRFCEKIIARSTLHNMSTAPAETQSPVGPRKRRWKRIVIRVALVLFVLWLGFVGFMWHTMRQPPEKFGAVMMHMPIPAVFLAAPFETMWLRARAGDLHPGDIAPEFNLQTLDKTSRVALSSLNARGPVVLVFGSYT